MTDSDFASGDPWGLDEVDLDTTAAPTDSDAPDNDAGESVPPVAELGVEDLAASAVELEGVDSEAEAGEDLDIVDEEADAVGLDEQALEATLAELGEGISTDPEDAVVDTPAEEPTRRRGPFSAMLAGTGLFEASSGDITSDDPEEASSDADDITVPDVAFDPDTIDDGMGAVEVDPIDMDIPDLDLSAIGIDAVDVPDLDIPDLQVPDFGMVEDDAIDMPDLDLTDITLPVDGQVDMPDLDLADIEGNVIDVDLPDADVAALADSLSGAGIDSMMADLAVPDMNDDVTEDEHHMPDLAPPQSQGGTAVPATDDDLPSDLPSWLSDDTGTERNEPPSVYKELENLEDEGPVYGAVLHTGQEAVEPFAAALGSDDPDEAIAAVAAAAAALDVEPAPGPAGVVDTVPDAPDEVATDEVPESAAAFLDESDGTPIEGSAETADPFAVLLGPPDLPADDETDEPAEIEIADEGEIADLAAEDAGEPDEQDDDDALDTAGDDAADDDIFTVDDLPGPDDIDADTAEAATLPLVATDETTDAPAPADSKAASTEVEPGVAWASRWRETAQGWQETPDGSTTWRPIVTTSSSLSEWTVDTYLGVVVGDTSIAAAAADESAIGAARQESTATMVNDALARGAHAVIGVSLAVQPMGERILVTASGTAVTLRTAG